MPLKTESDEIWSRSSGLIAGLMGLHFPPERWPDLKRGLAAAAIEFGFDNAVECAEWLLALRPGDAQLQVLACHLTVSETYFFREYKTLEVLANKVLPELIQTRRGRGQRLRIWSAACCTGEEAYTLAILLRQVLPDLADWQITILATDINPLSLRKAVAGVYSEWSFRDAPPNLRERFFNRRADGRYEVAPEIKAMVTFEHLNLVDDVYPSLATNTNAMDVIFCRNALMYFTPEHIRKAIERFRHSLLDGGWLAVSPSEASQELFSKFVTHNFPGAILYRKTDAHVSAGQSKLPPVFNGTEDFVAPNLGSIPGCAVEYDLPLERPQMPPASRKPTPTLMPGVAAASLYEKGCYADTVDTLLASYNENRLEPETFSLLVRSLANLGRLSEALTWCDNWIVADKLDPVGHYLRAVILLEQNELGQARRSLQRAVYLRHDFVLAHFALGNLARRDDKAGNADKHFRNALDLLATFQPDDLLQESDGLTAGRLAETITALYRFGDCHISTDCSVTTQPSIVAPAMQILRDRAISSSPQDTAAAANTMLEVLEFRLAQECFAVETHHVREVYPLKELTPLPGMPSFVIGIVNVRGHILPVINLKKFFDLPERGLTDLHRIIVVSGHGLELGLLTDITVGVRSIPMDSLQSSLPTLTGIRAEYLKGVTADCLAVLDLARILTDPKIIVHDDVEI